MNTLLLLITGFQQYLHQWDIMTFLAVPFLLILGDILTGILSALKRGVFAWKRVSSFLGNDGIKYIALLAVAGIVYLYGGQSVALTLVTGLGMGTLTISILGSIIENLTELSPPLGAVAEQVVGQIEQGTVSQGGVSASPAQASSQPAAPSPSA